RHRAAVPGRAPWALTRPRAGGADGRRRVPPGRAGVVALAAQPPAPPGRGRGVGGGAGGTGRPGAARARGAARPRPARAAAGTPPLRRIDSPSGMLAACPVASNTTSTVAEPISA